LCFGNKIKFCECDSKYILKEDGGIRVVYIRSFTKVMAVTVLIMFLLFGLTQTLLAQQPAGKILKKDIPQTKTAPAATRSVLTGKMLENIKITNLSVQDPQLNEPLGTGSSTELYWGVECSHSQPEQCRPNIRC